MAKKKKPVVPDEEHLSSLFYPRSTAYTTAIVDTHTHLLSTYQMYKRHYHSPKYEDIFSFVRGMYGTSEHMTISETPSKHKTEAIVDVWCEAPVIKAWRELADSALSDTDREKRWGCIDYWFVMGVHPHEAEQYTDDVEREILIAMEHPRCVGWGEIGLDYKKSHALHDVQQSVFSRQLRHAVRLGKPITIHTREAEADTERILKAEVPKDHPVHIHCFTDSPELALRLIDHFPNLYIGITGVITYSTNLNTSNLVRALVASRARPLRILLETDAPYMIPSNIYRDIANLPSGSKLPISHSGMVPWTAEWVAKVAAECGREGTVDNEIEQWCMDRVMREARQNARNVYGI